MSHFNLLTKNFRMGKAVFFLIVVGVASSLAGPDCPKGVMPCVDLMHPKNQTVYSTLAGHCRHATAGLKCMDRWTRSCLPREGLRTRFLDFVRESISGHNEFCDEPQNRAAYSSYFNSNCGQIPSPSALHKCSKIFTVRLLLRPDAPNGNGFCCNRLEYLNCAYRALPRGCDGEERRFAMRMYETQLMGLTKARSADLCAFEDKNFHLYCPEHSRGVLSNPFPEPTEEELVRGYF